MHRIRKRWDDLMDVDEEPVDDTSRESDTDGESDSEEVKALKVRPLLVIVPRQFIPFPPRNDAVTSAVSCNPPTINSTPLRSPPDTHRAPRSTYKSQRILLFLVTQSWSSTRTSCCRPSQRLPRWFSRLRLAYRSVKGCSIIQTRYFDHLP